MKRLIAALLILFALIFSTSFVVPQGSYALVSGAVINAGLHFKIPFIQKMTLGTTQPQLLLANGGTGNPFVSAQSFDQHHLNLGYALIWQVTDPLKFYQANLNTTALEKLRSELNSTIAEEASLFTLPQLLQTTSQQTLINNSLEKLKQSASDKGVRLTSLLLISMTVAEPEKTTLVAQIQKQQQAQLDDLRQKTAVLSQNLQAATDEKVAETVTNGQVDADKMRAKADQEATQIYADAYNKDPSFYEFYHNLQLYKKVLSSKQDVLVLGTDTPFFKSISAANTK